MRVGVDGFLSCVVGRLVSRPMQDELCQHRNDASSPKPPSYPSQCIPPSINIFLPWNPLSRIPYLE